MGIGISSTLNRMSIKTAKAITTIITHRRSQSFAKNRRLVATIRAHAAAV
jgi:hypothetical protein